MPCISVVMAVYNNEKYFPIAVKSILNQDYEDYELIIIDDGSTDRTAQIADEIASQNKNVRVIHQENQWIYASFNRGVQEAKGEYVYIVNSDDKLCPGALSLLAKNIEKYHPDVIWTKIVICRCDENQIILKNGKSEFSPNVLKDSVYLNQDEVRKAWFYFIKSGLLEDQANLYRRKLMIEHPFRNDIYSADTFFNISIASDVESAVVLGKTIYEHFLYGREDMNASHGKYYGYEHKMYNERLKKQWKLFEQWNIPLKEYKALFMDRRLKEITHEIRLLKLKSCNLSIEEKLKNIFCDYMDETIIQCAAELNAQEELESRILSGVRELLLCEEIREDSKMYFVYELLDSLLRYEKEESDYRKIENAIYNPLNPAHIGERFYNKLELVKGKVRKNAE